VGGWIDEWRKLTFLERHQVALSIAGAMSVVFFGVLTLVVSYSQISQERARERQAAIERNEVRNKLELKRSVRAFRGRDGTGVSHVH